MGIMSLVRIVSFTLRSLHPCCDGMAFIRLSLPIVEGSSCSCRSKSADTNAMVYEVCLSSS